MSSSILRPFGAALLLAAFHVSVATSAAQADIRYPLVPDWISSDHDVATGCAFGDLDQDGWLDMVVANGNDINRENVIVYYNNGDGTLPNNPSWAATDVDYHGHVSLGDVNGDGWLDVAVSVFLGPGGFGDKGEAKLYLNDGTGTLSSTPSWSTADEFYSFSLALGDADGDGDLDLAVATGDGYTGGPDQNRIYYNVGGALNTTPGWLSSEVEVSMDIAWGDMDGDGALDLVSGNGGDPLRIHYSVGGAIQTTSGWHSTSPSTQDANTIYIGDFNNDGYQDLVYSDNSQLNGTGRFYGYLNDGTGSMNTTPAWTSQYIGYCSGITLCDVDGDGLRDVIAGSWWGAVRMYLNSGSTFSTNADFISNTSSVVEAIPLGDVDNAGLIPTVGETHAGNGVKKVFYTDHAPVRSIERIEVDGLPILVSQYCYDAEYGWVSLSVTPSSEVSIDYTYTTSPDFAISNWDGGKGNYLFMRQDPLAVPYCFGDGSGTACPCGNNSSAGAGQGCRNSSTLGGVISAGGTRSVSADDLLVHAANLLHNQTGLLFTARNAIAGGDGAVFGDGLRCAGGALIRLGAKAPDSSGHADWGPGLGIKGGWSPGDTGRLQVWYRDPVGSPCGSDFNLTNGLEVSFLP